MFLRVRWWVAAGLSLIALLLLNNTAPLLHLFAVEPALADKTARYLSAISWGFPALLGYQTLRSLAEGFGITRPPMKIAIIAALANVPLNYLLIFGKLGLPALGGVGCGYATSILLWMMLLLALLFLRRDPRLANLIRLRVWRRPRWQEVAAFLRLGLPIGFSLMIEASMFSVIALLLAVDGEAVGRRPADHHQRHRLDVHAAFEYRHGDDHPGGSVERTGATPQQARFSVHCGLGLTILIAVFNAANTACWPDV